jgi:hypothetical protein
MVNAQEFFTLEALGHFAGAVAAVKVVSLSIDSLSGMRSPASASRGRPVRWKPGRIKAACLYRFSGGRKIC